MHWPCRTGVCYSCALILGLVTRLAPIPLIIIRIVAIISTKVPILPGLPLIVGSGARSVDARLQGSRT